MGHPAYDMAYEMTINIIQMGFKAQFFWMPLVVMGAVIGVLKWVQRRAMRGPGVDSYEESYVQFRGEMNRLPQHWESTRRRKGW